MSEPNDLQVPTLWESHSLRVEPAAQITDPPTLVVGETRVPIPAWCQWFGGLRCLVDGEWQRARFIALLATEGDPDLADVEAHFDGCPGARVRVEVGSSEFLLEELTYWPFEVDPNSEVRPHEDRDFALPKFGLSGELPRLPAGWAARRLLMIQPWGLRWEATNVVEGGTCSFDHLKLPWAVLERLMPCLLLQRDAGEQLLGGQVQLWFVRDGLLIARSPTEQTLRQAQLSGDIDWAGLLGACFHTAAGLDWLAEYGFGARRAVNLDSIGVRPGDGDSTRAWIFEAGYPDSVDLAEAGRADWRPVEALPPERRRGEPPGAAGDQFALALAYIEARTDLVPSDDLAPVDLLQARGRAGLQSMERQILARALADDPGQRWPSCRAFVATLAASVGLVSPWVTRFAEPSQWQAAPAANVVPLARHQLTVSAYRRLFEETSPPSPAQIESFIEFVAFKHSWYKRLPLTHPGVDFRVFLDPTAGMRVLQYASGELRLGEILEDEPFRHHATLPTKTYRQRFGLLRLEGSAVPSYSVHSEGQADHLAGLPGLPGLLVNGRLLSLPPEVAFASNVNLTALIHPECRLLWVWRHFLFETFDGEPLPDEPDLYWPDASGGPAVLRAIRCLIRDSRLQADQAAKFGDAYLDYRTALELLIAPERERQRQLLRSAIGRVVDLVYG